MNTSICHFHRNKAVGKILITQNSDCFSVSVQICYELIHYSNNIKEVVKFNAKKILISSYTVSHYDFPPLLSAKYLENIRKRALRFLFYDYESAVKSWETKYVKFSPTYLTFLSSYIYFIFSHALGVEIYIINKISTKYLSEIFQLNI